MKTKKCKKPLILFVLKLLETNSDENHPIRQTELANTISSVYPCDRKTVGRNIRVLKEIGYPIEKTKAGFYLSGKRFTVEESEWILRAVENSQEIPEKEKNDLINRLSSLMNKIYR